MSTRFLPVRLPTRLTAALAAGLLLLAACGDDDDDTAAIDPAGDTSTEDGDDAGTDDGDDAGGEVPVTTAETDLGPTLVTASTELTLYGFLPDSGGEPTCTDACADAWPPLFVDSAELPAGLDSSVFSVVEYPDGRFQLAAGGWPLYRFAGDATAGDVAGQGSGDQWFAAAPDGSLIDAPEPEEDAAGSDGRDY